MTKTTNKRKINPHPSIKIWLNANDDLCFSVSPMVNDPSILAKLLYGLYGNYMYNQIIEKLNKKYSTEFVVQTLTYLQNYNSGTKFNLPIVNPLTTLHRHD
jgi:hypothetical protein